MGLSATLLRFAPLACGFALVAGCRGNGGTGDPGVAKLAIVFDDSMGQASLGGEAKRGAMLAVDEVRGIERVREELGAAIVELVAPRVGQARAPGYEGEGYAIVKGETTEGVQRALSRLVSEVRVDAG